MARVYDEKIMKTEIEQKTKLGSVEAFFEIGLTMDNLKDLYPLEKGSEFIFKLDFLSDFVFGNYSTSTFKQYVTLLKKIKPIEEYYGRDVCDFTAEEMIALLKTFRTKSYNSIGSKYSLLKNYINVAKSHKIGKVTAPTGLLLKPEDLRSTISEYKRDSSYCTRTELEKALDIIDNPNDRIVYALLFEGVSGDKYEDLLNIKDKDINLEENTLITPSGKTYYFSDYTKKIIEDCMVQTEAVMFDGKRVYKIDTASPYVVKGKLTEMSNGEAMKYAGLIRKLTAVRKNMELDFITGKAVYASGILERMCMYEHFDLGRELATLEIATYIENSSDDKDRNTMIRLAQNYREKFKADLEKRNWEIKGKKR